MQFHFHTLWAKGFLKCIFSFIRVYHLYKDPNNNLYTCFKNQPSSEIWKKNTKHLQLQIQSPNETIF